MRELISPVAYAQGWARNIKPAEAVRSCPPTALLRLTHLPQVKRIRTDPHSPTNFRVIGPLSNNDDFAKAFGCKVGQPMRNERQCKVRFSWVLVGAF